MQKEEISTLSNVVIGFSTFIATGGALAFYVKEVTGKGTIMMMITLLA